MCPVVTESGTINQLFHRHHWAAWCGTCAQSITTGSRKHCSWVCICYTCKILLWAQSKNWRSITRRSMPAWPRRYWERGRDNASPWPWPRSGIAADCFCHKPVVKWLEWLPNLSYVQSRVKEARQWTGKHTLLMQSLENLAGLRAVGSTDAKLRPSP